MMTKNANLERMNIAIPQNRFEAMLLGKKILSQLAIIERCIDEAIADCEARDRSWQRAA